MNLTNLLLGVRVQGESLPTPKFSTCHFEKADFFEWCKEFNVSCRTFSLAMYSPIKSEVKC